MPKRSIRVNELIKREISQILHTAYRSEAVCITITEVQTAPDMKTGRVYYSVIGDENVILKAQEFFKQNAGSISARAGKHIVLKYFPKLRYTYDEAYERGIKTMQLLDKLEEERQN